MRTTNLLDLLKSSKELTSGMIASSQLVEKLEIYGFIPCAENTNPIPLDMRLGIIASDRILFSVEQTSLLDLSAKKESAILPIYRKLVCDKAEHSLLLENLYVHALSTNHYYKEFRNRKQINLQQLKKASSQIFIDDSSKVHYRTLPEEILMYKKTSYSTDCVSAVTSCFLVVCRFVNSVTGNVSYVVYSPEDLFFSAK